MRLAALNLVGRLLKCPADGLIIGPGERGGARHQFGAADGHLAFFLLSLA